MPFSLDVAVIGGCGHAGLPLAIAFAERGPDPSGEMLDEVIPWIATAVTAGLM